MTEAIQKATPLSSMAQAIEADQALQPKATEGQDTAAEQAEQAQAAQAMAMVEAGVASVMLALLKVGRAWVAKRLPEIREEWTDEALEAPAQAAVPLVRKHLETLMQLAGSSPEVAAFALACFPLAMGAVAAMDKASEREKRERAAVLAANAGGAVG